MQSVIAPLRKFELAEEVERLRGELKALDDQRSVKERWLAAYEAELARREGEK